MQKRLTLEDIKNARAPHYLDTLYGFQVGIRRLSAGFVARTQLLFAAPIGVDGGGYKDPLGIGFLDVECPSCGALAKAPCSSFASETIPHDGRVSASHADRAGRGNRGALRASIVDPPVTDELLEFLEADPRALVDLMGQIVTYNGLGPGDRTEAGRTFREGDPG